MRRLPRTLLILAGALTAAMGLYHFFLPYQYGWPSGVAGAPPMIRWALFALNAFFSTLLLMLGALVILAASRRLHATLLGACIVAAGAAFWAVNGAYQIAVPMPIPSSMPLLRIALPAFSFSALLLHAAPLAFIAGVAWCASNAAGVQAPVATR